LVFEALALDSDHGAKTNRRSMSEIWTDDIEAGRRAIAAIRSIGRDDVKLSNRSQSSGQTIEQIQHKIDATEVLLKSAVGT
jgi:4-hydroxy-3-methylbut-2-en-1-yl diphosphate synthase IspG/GcpE